MATPPKKPEQVKEPQLGSNKEPQLGGNKKPQLRIKELQPGGNKEPQPNLKAPQLGENKELQLASNKKPQPLGMQLATPQAGFDQTQTQHAQQTWLAVRFPMLALECLTQTNPQGTHKTATAQQPNPDQPFCVHQKQRIYMANSAAINVGIRKSMSTTQARVLQPEITILLRDQAREKACFAQAFKQLYCITPHLKSIIAEHQGQAEYCLALEVSSCLKLFGGWQKLLDYLDALLAELPYHSVYATAHSQQAAWLLTWNPRHNPRSSNPNQQQEHIKQLSTHYLVFFPKQVQQLQRMGFMVLQDLWQQINQAPNLGHQNTHNQFAAIQKRFGREFSDYLKAVFGYSTSSQKPLYQPSEYFTDQIEFDYPVNNVEWLLHSGKTLLQRLSHFLVQRNVQTQHVTWHLHDRDQNHHRIVVSSSTAAQKSELFFELSQILFEQQSLPFAVDELRLECRKLQPLNQTTTDLFHSVQSRDNDLEKQKIATRIDARLGNNALVRLSALAEHLPELSQTTTPALAPSASVTPSNTSTVKPVRPTWLIEPPQKIQHKPNGLFWHGYLTVQQGPERITGQWWHKPEERDYFLALRDDFVRCWIFYERIHKAWYVQGIFS